MQTYTTPNPCGVAVTLSVFGSALRIQAGSSLVTGKTDGFPVSAHKCQYGTYRKVLAAIKLF